MRRRASRIIRREDGITARTRCLRSAVAAAVMGAAIAGVAPRTGAQDLVPRAALELLQATPPAPVAMPSSRAPHPVSLKRAMLYSALVPGLGEAYSGHPYRAVLQGSAEAAVWTSYATFKVQEGLREDRAREFAIHEAGAVPNGDEDYYKAVGQYLRAEGPGMWNEFVRRRARDTGEVVGREYTGAEAWAWTSEASFDRYRKLRRDMLTAGDRATNTLAFALLNRVVSVVSVMQAVRADHAHEHRLGMRIDPGRDPFEVARIGLWEHF
jgi:hypothetical protein